MSSSSILIGLVFVVVAGRLIYGRLKHRSWTGSLLKGHIERTLGQVTLSSGLGSQAFVVHSMRAGEGGNEFVALVVVSKAPLGASMQPYKLTKAQARDLANYLEQASK
jgi:hypothetical protein